MPAHLAGTGRPVRLSAGPCPGAVLGSTLVTALLSAGIVVGGAGASYAIDGDDCTDINQVGDPGEGEVTTFDGAGSPIRALQVETAQKRVLRLTGRTAGDGVTVAVLDSGVSEKSELELTRGVPAPGASRTPALVWFQGTLLAGIIAAAPDPKSASPVGIAPGATIFDQRIYDTGSGADDLTVVGPDSVAAGLEAIAPLVDKGEIELVTVGVVGPDSARLRAAVDRVTDKGAIIVAATASRSDLGPDSDAAVYQDGEDHADLFFPAGYAKTNSRVVSVATTAAPGEVGVADLDLIDYLVFSSAIDVAAPTAGAVSLGINGRYCSIRKPSTAVAAAEVAGVLALLMTAYPDDTPEQLIARLEATASGSTSTDPASPDTRAGKGIVQPLEALTRPLSPSRNGQLSESPLPEQQATPAVIPVPDPDVLASTRDNAVWWGLLGGGALVVLVLLRPVLSRRR